MTFDLRDEWNEKKVEEHLYSVYRNSLQLPRAAHGLK